MRGVNHAHTWYPTQTSAFADIKALGANTVRVVLSSGDRWTKNDAADVANVIALCKPNRLICVLEVHDTTGYGEQSGAITLDQAVDYWISVAERPRRPGEATSSSTSATSRTATTAARAAGPPTPRTRSSGCATPASTHTIMVDAPNWGQDWAFTMRDNAASVFAADPRPQHHLLDPHVRRLRHRRRDHRLPRPVRHRRSCRSWSASSATTTPTATPTRTPSCRTPSADGSATSAGRGAATAAASSTSTWSPASTRPAHQLGPADLQRRQRHQATAREATVYGGVTSADSPSAVRHPRRPPRRRRRARPRPRRPTRRRRVRARSSTASSGSGRAGSRAT